LATLPDPLLLDAARRIAPLARDHADLAEKNRRLSPSVLEALNEAGIFRLLLPRSLGGLETDPVTYGMIVEEVARGDPAAGWVIQAGNIGAWWSASFPKEGVETVYRSNPSALIAAAFHPPQQAIEVDGGYQITGRGPLASNIHDADWLFLTAFVMDGQQPRMTPHGPEMVGLTLMASEAQIIDTWHSLGMRGTDSNDVAVDGVFVPKARSYPLAPGIEPNEHYRGPLYRLPVMAVSSLIGGPVALAIGREAISELRTLAERKTAFGFVKPLKERTAVQATLAKAEAMLRSARLLLYQTVGDAWERAVAGHRSTLEQKADLLLAGAHAASTGAAVTGLMHGLAGTTGIYQRNRIERLFRDANTVKHHGFVSESRFEAVGQVYLGLPPDFGMVAF
jgi:alkylation response protein AidB-like acyl-CoA dehydrogenase